VPASSGAPSLEPLQLVGYLDAHSRQRGGREALDVTPHYVYAGRREGIPARRKELQIRIRQLADGQAGALSGDDGESGECGSGHTQSVPQFTPPDSSHGC
jgi:hypothetical protein